MIFFSLEKTEFWLSA